MSSLVISKRGKPEETTSRTVNRPFSRQHARPGGLPSQDGANVWLPGATRPLAVSRPTDTAEREASRHRDALDHDGATPPPVPHRLTASKMPAPRWDSGAGAPMPAVLRVSASRAFDADFSSVRVHDDARAQSWAEQLRASAFTVGADIYFGAGQFRPQTQDGRRLIAHELTHVVQHAQSSGEPRIHRMSIPSSEDVAAEGREVGLERKRHDLQVLLDDGAFGRALDLLHTLNEDVFSTVVNGLTNVETNSLLAMAEARGDGGLVQQIREIRGLMQSDLPPMSPLAAEMFDAEHGQTLNSVRSLIRAGKYRKVVDLLGWLNSTAFDAVVDALTTEETNLLLERGRVLSTRATRDKIRAKRSQEVVINTVLLSNANDTINLDLARANQIYNPIGIEVERGARGTLRPSQLQGTGTFDANSADHIDRFIANFSDPRRITAFWVNGLVQNWAGFHQIVEKSADGIIIETVGRRQDTFAHELGHALGLPHLTENPTDPGADPNNLLASGSYRTTSGVAGSDVLNSEQQKVILRSALLESGRRGVGR